MAEALDAVREPEFVGMEEWRRQLGLSKATFYGPHGPAKAVRVIQISSRRLVVSRQERERFYASRTREPEQVA